MDSHRNGGADDDTIAETTTLSNATLPEDPTTPPATGVATNVPTHGLVDSPSADAIPLSAISAPARYRLESVIGRGGMGEIVSAHDEQIGRSVAIKRMTSDDPSPEAIARFLREARIQGRLEHPAVVPVHELWRDGRGQPFFVMKQLSGTTLHDVLTRIAATDHETMQRFPRSRLLRAFAEVCLAVEFAHTRGVVHRDLKPGNIMLGDFGEVYVLDWGIARVMEEAPGRTGFADIGSLDGIATVAGDMLGTPGYMSPEQIRGDADLDSRADVYALGCILFEILSGQPLHPRGHAGIAHTLIGVDARPSVRVDRETPPELDAVCVAATALDRNDRIATTRALGDAVQRYLDGDRDLALRRDLAGHELAAARAAFARRDTLADRRVAFRAAARALALDPQAAEPAELVGRLMIEPPAVCPPEVEVELEDLDRRALRSQQGMMLLVFGSYLVFFPMMYVAGFRDTWYLIAGPVLVAVLIAMSLVLRRHPTMNNAYVVLAANTLLIALFSRVLSPFLFAPALAIASAMTFASHVPRARPWLIFATNIAAVLGPLLIELSGAASPTTIVTDEGLILHAGKQVTLGAVATGLAMFVVGVVAFAVVTARSIVRSRRDMQRTLQIQSWQLRQLLTPAAT